jgi:hypothetical protein
MNPGEDLSTAAFGACIFPTPAGAVFGGQATPQTVSQWGQSLAKVQAKQGKEHSSFSSHYSASSRPIKNAKGILHLIIALSLATNLEPLLSLYDSRETAGKGD